MSVVKHMMLQQPFLECQSEPFQVNNYDQFGYIEMLCTSYLDILGIHFSTCHSKLPPRSDMIADLR
jgi:hypothetical protein